MVSVFSFTAGEDSSLTSIISSWAAYGAGADSTFGASSSAS